LFRLRHSQDGLRASQARDPWLLFFDGRESTCQRVPLKAQLTTSRFSSRTNPRTLESLPIGHLIRCPLDTSKRPSVHCRPRALAPAILTELSNESAPKAAACFGRSRRESPRVASVLARVFFLAPQVDRDSTSGVQIVGRFLTWRVTKALASHWWRPNYTAGNAAAARRTAANLGKTPGPRGSPSDASSPATSKIKNRSHLALIT